MPWLAQKSFNMPNPNPQNATGVQPSAFGGFGTHAPGTTSQSILLSLHLQRETCRTGHSPHHVLRTFRPFLVKATGAAQTDFGLLQLQVDRKLLLNWICLGVQRNRLCHTAGPVQLMNPIPPVGN